MFQILQPRVELELLPKTIWHTDWSSQEMNQYLLYLSYLLNYRHPSLYQEYHDSAQWQHS